MRNLQLIALVAVAMLVGTACGGGQSVETADGSETAAAGSEVSDVGQGGGGTEGADTPPDNEFQLSNSDDADQARGERPSEIESTETEAAVRLFVVNPDAGPIPGVVVKMTSPGGGVYYTRPTDSLGYAEVLVPIGQRYEMEYLSLGRRNTTAAVEIPAQANYDVRLTLRYRQYVPPEEEPEFVLDGVEFDTNRATLRPESFPRLDRVVEYLQHKPDSRIRIEGHTDNVGNPRANQRLSQRRAQAVKDYLVSRGIDGSRIEAIGHGDTQPVASNDTEEGRQQNRRIEATEL